MEYNIVFLFLCIVTSVLSYVVLTRGMQGKVKMFYAIFILFFTLYSGVGGAMTSVPQSYMGYYLYYLFVFTVASSLFNKWFLKCDISYKSPVGIGLFISKYASSIVLFYVIINLCQLVYPENKLGNLIHPPSPDIMERLNFYREGGDSSVFHYLEILLTPFFYLSLYKYKNQIGKIILLLIGLLYITYCNNLYLGRETILVSLAIVYFAIYYNSSPKKRKILLTMTIIAVPLGVLFFVYYSYLRVGQIADQISFADAMLLLFSQETNYPELFSSYINQSGKLVGEYFEWLLLLPFPSFFKMGHGGTLFNELFTNVSIERYSWESGFSIALPGIVGEGIFIFKESLFFHAIILAFIVSITINYVCKYEYYIFIYFYVLIKLPLGISRSGTQGVYSIIAKALIFVIFLYFYNNINRKRSLSQ